MSTALEKLTPATTLTVESRRLIFEHFYRRLAAFRNTAELYAVTEHELSLQPPHRKAARRDNFIRDLNGWAQGLLEHAWTVFDQPGGGRIPRLNSFSETSTRGLEDMPPIETFSRNLNTILFLQVTTSKQYSSRTRAFLSSFGPLDESIIVSTLKNPDRFMEDAKKQAEASQQRQASQNKNLRMVGMGLGAIAGGILVGVTGGLAAPLVGATFASVFGFLGIAGPVVTLITSGLAGSSVICGALFGIYGAHSTAGMIERHTRDVEDLALVPMGEQHGEESLAVRLCISGWLESPDDVVAPWTIFDTTELDTFALRWEVEALQNLSSALYALLKERTMKYLQWEVLRRTMLAPLMLSLMPMALLNIGYIIDNPWSNARARALKAGAVLGDLLSKRVFGTRPVTLTGFSLGSLVILEALKTLATLPPAQVSSIVQDVYLFGTPAPTDAATWASVRRVVAGRLVNGYSTKDYILSFLSRASHTSMTVAGLHSVDIRGVDNILCDQVDGHVKWRTMIGSSLQAAGAPGLSQREIEIQLSHTIADEPMEFDGPPQYPDSDNKFNADFSDDEGEPIVLFDARASTKSSPPSQPPVTAPSTLDDSQPRKEEASASLQNKNAPWDPLQGFAQ